MHRARSFVPCCSSSRRGCFSSLSLCNSFNIEAYVRFVGAEMSEIFQPSRNYIRVQVQYDYEKQMYQAKGLIGPEVIRCTADKWLSRVMWPVWPCLRITTTLFWLFTDVEEGLGLVSRASDSSSLFRR